MRKIHLRRAGVPSFAGVVAAIALALTLGGCAASPGGSGGAPSPEAAAGGFLYVANQEAAAITVIDLASNEVVQVIDLEALGYGANPKPHHIVVEPDGSFWYVSLIGAGKVLKFDRNNELVGSADFEVPGLMALDPNSNWLFVGRSMAAVNPPQRIGRIDRRTMEVEEFDVFIPRPHAIAVGPRGHVYVGSLAENTIAVVDAESGETNLVPLNDPQPHAIVQFAVSPDQSTLVGTGQLSGKLLVFSTAGSLLTLEREIDVGLQPWHPSFTPDGRQVWLGALVGNEVTVVDTDSWTVTATIAGRSISEPHGSAVSPDGRYVYIANRNEDGSYPSTRDFGFDEPDGNVSVIDAQTLQIVDVIDTPPYAAGLGLAAGIRGRRAEWSRRVTPFEVADADGRPYEIPFLGGFNTPRPQLVDIDEDGDLDLFVQESTDRLLFFRREDSPEAPEHGDAAREDAPGTGRYVFEPDAFSDLRIGEWYRFVDVDGDGDRDLLAEQPFSYIRLYRNDGDASLGGAGRPTFEPVADTIRDTRGEAIFSDRQNIPNAADLDCDGMLDLLIGRIAGTVTHYEATGAIGARAAPFRHITDRFEGIEIIADPAAAGRGAPASLPSGPLEALPRSVAEGAAPLRHGANTMALADVDGDGDVDLYWGDFFEPGILFIENRGSCELPNLRTTPRPFPLDDPIQTSGYNAPTFGDLDGDGDLDLVMGVLGGAYDPNTTTADNLYAFIQTEGGHFRLETRRFISQIDVGSESVASLVDLDADGDLDLVVGNRIDPSDLQTSHLYEFENVGTATAPALRALGRLKIEGEGVDPEFHNAPAFGDLDGDGDLDMVMGTWRRDLHYVENTGSPTEPRFETRDAAYVALTRGSNAIPTLGDLDGDGDLDLIVGESAGTLSYYENRGDARSARFELVSDRYLDADVGRRSAPVLCDVDGDGDLDLAVGSETDGLVLYENHGTPRSPDLVRTEAALPPPEDLPALVTPTFGDLDGDGDLDLVTGGAGGGVSYFERW